MSKTLPELSDRLIELIRTTDDTLRVCFFLNKHNENARNIINTPGRESGKTPLMVACDVAQLIPYGYETFNLLLSFRPDTNVTDKYHNKSALAYSMPFGYSKLTNRNSIKLVQKNNRLRQFICKTLIENGADVNVRDQEGRTLLMNAASSSDEFIDLLIRSGANLDAQDHLGRTALMYFIQSSNGKVLDLLKMNANIFIKDVKGKRAIDFVDVNQSASSGFILELTRAYLQPLYSYFKETDSNQIRLDTSTSITEANKSQLFPIKNYHLASLKILSQISFYKFDLTSIIHDLEFLFYFSSSSFERSLSINVIDVLKNTPKNKLATDELTKRLNLTCQVLKESMQALARVRQCWEKMNDHSTDNWKCLTLELAKIYFTSLRGYFERETGKDLTSLPIKTHHLTILDGLLEIISADGAHINIDYLHYFASPDFLEKSYLNLINNISQKYTRMVKETEVDDVKKSVKLSHLNARLKLAANFLAKSQLAIRKWSQAHKKTKSSKIVKLGPLETLIISIKQRNSINFY